MMYHRFINDREVFSECKTIRLDDGTVISNPSEQQILDAGWEVYVPPVVPPTPQEEPDMDQIVDAVKKMLSQGAEQLSDEDALGVAALYPTWASKIGEEVTAGDRLWYDGNLYKVIQAHTTQADWTPDTAVSLFRKVSLEEVPEWVQPLGAEDAYDKGDKVKHNGKTWESDFDGKNVWEPGVFGWIEI